MNEDDNNIVLDFVKFHKNKDKGSINIGRHLIKYVEINNGSPMQFEYHKDTKTIILTPLSPLSSKITN